MNLFNKKQTILKNLISQFDIIEKALLKAKEEGRKTINLKKELELIQSPKDEPSFYDEGYCGKPENHNNGEIDNCVECIVIKNNL